MGSGAARGGAFCATLIALALVSPPAWADSFAHDGEPQPGDPVFFPGPTKKVGEYRMRRLECDETWTGRILCYRGDEEQPLRGPVFYEVLGRPDLAKKWRSWRPAWVAVGSVVLAGGLTLETLGLALLTGRPRGERPTLYSEFALGGGIVLCIASIPLFVRGLRPLEPLSAEHRLEAVDKYDADLRHELGLPDDTSRNDVAPRRPIIHWGFGASPHGFAFGILGRF